jgi:protein-S-isoprenylcysteine O-methyltransferase
MSERVDFWLGASALLVACMPWWLALLPLLLTFADDLLKNAVLQRSKGLMYVVNYTLSKAVQGSVWYLAKDLTDVSRVALGALGIALCVFPVCEFLCTAYFSPQALCLRAFHPYTYWTHWAVGCLAAAEWTGREAVSWNLRTLQGFCLITGLTLVIVGASFMVKARIDAGNCFLPKALTEQDPKLVSTGVYSVCRHPWYFGWALWSIGLWLVSATPATALCAAGLNAITLRRKIEVEELGLKQVLEEYRGYMSETRRLPRGLGWLAGV